jgi:hypothetical protein
MNPFDAFAGMGRDRIDDLYEKTYVDDSIVRAVLSRVPPSWSVINLSDSGGWFKRGSLQVGITVQRYGSSDIWVHVSVCGRKGQSLGPGDPRHMSSYYLPSFEELKRVKHDFVGEDRWAYQVFPSSKDYVNQQPHTLHLYALMDGKPALPDFTMGLGTI